MTPATVTAAQLRDVVGRLIRAGHHVPGDPDVLLVMDVGFDIIWLAWLLQDLPVVLVGQARSDWVFHAPRDGVLVPRRVPARHGRRLKLKVTSTWPGPQLGDHEPRPTRMSGPSSRPPRLSEHPPDHHPSSQTTDTENHPSRPRTPTRHPNRHKVARRPAGKHHPEASRG